MSYSMIARAPAQERSLRVPLSRLMMMIGIKRERQALGSLDPALLRDIGISPEDAQREARRPAWDAPNRWF
ncbi:DUF1127 domain-containing protein [Pseudooceanicola algae]|uniref:YjiS-like domain-containing protein n=1 Tax=Pseudooceanicola algae TaxID=1537215 RepID=A0A418SKY3_9RHOB|nr:DUF1127 domain-containing protein [Pseudooceanicola algae]QPM90983.1 hypothetical protein PSAL_022260 [Pseudooceanicola algae]